MIITTSPPCGNCGNGTITIDGSRLTFTYDFTIAKVQRVLVRPIRESDISLIRTLDSTRVGMYDVAAL